MRAARWLALIWVLVCFGSISTVEAQDAAPTLTRIGRGAIQNAAWHPWGDYILVSTVTGAWIYTPDFQDLAHLPDAELAALSPDGRYIAGVNAQHQLLIWDGITFEPVEVVLNEQFLRIQKLVWSPDGRYLTVSALVEANLTGGVIDTVQVYDRTQSWLFVGGIGGGTQIEWSPTSKYMAVYTPGGIGRIWEIGLPRFTPFVVEEGGEARWKDETTLLIYNYLEGYYYTYLDASTGKETGHFESAAKVVYSHDNHKTVYDFYNGVGITWGDEPTNQYIIEQNNRYQSSAWFITMFSWRHDDAMVAVGTQGRSWLGSADSFVIDVENQQLVHKLEEPVYSIKQFAWSSNNRYLLVLDGANQLWIYDTTSWQLTANTSEHALVGDALDWNPDGTQIAFGDRLGNVTLWNIAENHSLAILSGATSIVSRIDWHPQGYFIGAETHESVYHTYGTSRFHLWDMRAIPFKEITDQIVNSSSLIYASRFGWSANGERLVAVGGNAVALFDITDDVIEISKIHEFSSTEEWRFESILLNDDGTAAVLVINLYYGIMDILYTLEDDEFRILVQEPHFQQITWHTSNEVVDLNWGWCSHGCQIFVEPHISRIIADPQLEPTSEESDLSGFSDSIKQGFLSPLGTYVGAVDQSGSGLIWDTQTGRIIAGVPDAAQMVWSPDETGLVVQRQDGGIWLMESDGTILEQFPISPSVQEPVGSFYWSPDGTQIAHLHDGVIDLWMVGN